MARRPTAASALDSPPSELVAELEDSSVEYEPWAIPSWSRLRPETPSAPSTSIRNWVYQNEEDRHDDDTDEEPKPALDRAQIMLKVLTSLQDQQRSARVKPGATHDWRQKQLADRQEKLRTSRCLGPTLKNQRQHGRAVPLAVRAGVVAVLRQLFPHRFEDDEVQVQVARPLVSKDGMLKLPRLEAVIYGRKAPFSGCCGCSLLSFFDAECGVAVICTRQTCRSPALQLQPLSQPRRLQLWGPFLALTGGVLPRHRPPPASCVENAVAPEDGVSSMVPQHLALLVENPSPSPEMKGSSASPSEGEREEHEDLRRASEEAIVTYEDMVPDVPCPSRPHHRPPADEVVPAPRRTHRRCRLRGHSPRSPSRGAASVNGLPAWLRCASGPRAN
mmetsp:Transcript_26968/g.55965  ORF Transcript_26968/g.55965 Transcript_26968/m.55965 type:complete len:389 (+) Transcript_26968:56-1222(+)